MHKTQLPVHRPPALGRDLAAQAAQSLLKIGQLFDIVGGADAGQVERANQIRELAQEELAESESLERERREGADAASSGLDEEETDAAKGKEEEGEVVQQHAEWMGGVVVVDTAETRGDRTAAGDKKGGAAEQNRGEERKKPLPTIPEKTANRTSKRTTSRWTNGLEDRPHLDYVKCLVNSQLRALEKELLLEAKRNLVHECEMNLLPTRAASAGYDMNFPVYVNEQGLVARYGRKALERLQVLLFGQLSGSSTTTAGTSIQAPAFLRLCDLPPSQFEKLDQIRAFADAPDVKARDMAAGVAANRLDNVLREQVRELETEVVLETGDALFRSLWKRKVLRAAERTEEERERRKEGSASGKEATLFVCSEDEEDAVLPPDQARISGEDGERHSFLKAWYSDSARRLLLKLDVLLSTHQPTANQEAKLRRIRDLAEVEAGILWAAGGAEGLRRGGVFGTTAKDVSVEGELSPRFSGAQNGSTTSGDAESTTAGVGVAGADNGDKLVRKSEQCATTSSRTRRTERRNSVSSTASAKSGTSSFAGSSSSAASGSDHFRSVLHDTCAHEKVFSPGGRTLVQQGSTRQIFAFFADEDADNFSPPHMGTSSQESGGRIPHLVPESLDPDGGGIVGVGG